MLKKVTFKIGNLYGVIPTKVGMQCCSLDANWILVPTPTRTSWHLDLGSGWDYLTNAATKVPVISVNNQILFDGALVAVALNTPIFFWICFSYHLYRKAPFGGFSLHQHLHQVSKALRAMENEMVSTLPEMPLMVIVRLSGRPVAKKTPLTKDEESDGWLEPKTTWFNELSATFVLLSFTPSSVNMFKLLGHELL